MNTKLGSVNGEPSSASLADELTVQRLDINDREAWDVGSYLVRGRLATVVNFDLVPGGSILPAVNHHYWPKSITYELIREVVAVARARQAIDSHGEAEPTLDRERVSRYG